MLTCHDFSFPREPQSHTSRSCSPNSVSRACRGRARALSPQEPNLFQNQPEGLKAGWRIHSHGHPGASRTHGATSLRAEAPFLSMAAKVTFCKFEGVQKWLPLPRALTLNQCSLEAASVWLSHEPKPENLTRDDQKHLKVSRLL